jgi:hypothetical protein
MRSFFVAVFASMFVSSQAGWVGFSNSQAVTGGGAPNAASMAAHSTDNIVFTAWDSVNCDEQKGGCN